jgi:hypothetical protein
MSRITDLEALASAAKRAGLSRREFLERAAQAGIIAGAVGFDLPSAFAQAVPPPGKPNILTAPNMLAPPSGFTPASGFSLAGSIANDNTLTIAKSGGGFGTKPNGAAPVAWYPFQTSLGLSDLSRGSELGVGLNRSLSTVKVCPGSRASVAYDLVALYNSAQGFWRGTFVTVLAPTTFTKCYTWVKRYYDFDQLAKADLNTFIPHNFNLKWNRAVPNPMTWPDAYVAQGVSPVGSPATYGLRTNVTTVEWSNGAGTANYGDFQKTGQAWQVWEAYMYTGTVGNTDAALNHFVNATSFYSTAPPAQKWLLSGSDKLPQALSIDEAENLSIEMRPCNIYYDALYMDDSWCRILISDEPSYTVQYGPTQTAYTREIQIPTAWRDGNISFVLRQGSHASLSGKSLYVITADGTALRAGVFA